jgi:hypothetical protein
MMKTTLTLILAAFLCADGIAQDRGRERIREAGQEKKQEKKQDKTDWNKKYAAYLKKNPAIAKKVKSGDITKAQVIAGMKARFAEKQPSEEEQLEALYQQMLKDRPGMKDIPRERLMPRLKAMLAAQRKEKRGGDERRGGDEADDLAGRQRKFRAKLGEFVRAGKISRAEAGELWKLAYGDEGRGGGRRGEGEERRRRDGDKGKGDERRRRRDR